MFLLCFYSTDNLKKHINLGNKMHCPFVPVMVVTHSRRRVLISVRSQAPASVGAGRGMILDECSDMSGFEVDVEGQISAWKGINC